MSLPLLTNIRIFSLMALTSLIQLGMCIHSEYLRYQIMIMMMMMRRIQMMMRMIWYLTMINFRQKSPSCWKACRVTTQKMLYFLTFVASRFLFSKSSWLSPLHWSPHFHPHHPYYRHHHHYHQLSHTFGIKNFVSLSIFFCLIPILILLIIFIFFICITFRSLRAIYFASPQLGSSMSASLMSAYYPVDHFVVTYNWIFCAIFYLIRYVQFQRYSDYISIIYVSILSGRPLCHYLYLNIFLSNMVCSISKK